MAIFQVISLVLIAMLLMMLLAQARPWFRAKVQGKVLQVSTINLWQRVQMHRSTLLALAMGLFLGRTSGLLPDSAVALAVFFIFGILCLPMQYTFTTQGVAVGTAIFRPWSEFSGIVIKKQQIVLEHTSFSGRLTLFVKSADLEKVLVRIKVAA